MPAERELTGCSTPRPVSATNAAESRRRRARYWRRSWSLSVSLVEPLRRSPSNRALPPSCSCSSCCPKHPLGGPTRLFIQPSASPPRHGRDHYEGRGPTLKGRRGPARARTRDPGPESQAAVGAAPANVALAATVAAAVIGASRFWCSVETSRIVDHDRTARAARPTRRPRRQRPCRVPRPGRATGSARHGRRSRSSRQPRTVRA